MQHRARDMDDRSSFDPSQDPQVWRIFRKLAFISDPPKDDTEVAALFPGYQFDLRLIAGITPIERGGPLDFYINRPDGLKGWIINLTVEGLGQVLDGEQAFSVAPGDLLLFPPGVRHYYGRAPEAEKWWHRWIYFQPRAFWKPWLKWERQAGGVFVLRDGEPSQFSELFRLFAEVEKWSVLDDNLSIDLAFNRLEEILLSCARADRSARAPSSIVDDRVLAACRFITDNLHKPLGVKEVAEHVCLSPSRMSHLFRKYVGTGIMQWRDAQRVQYAMQVLRITNMPIKMLSQAVGYDDPLYFSRVFRKHTNLSPRTFRERSLEALQG